MWLLPIAVAATAVGISMLHGGEASAATNGQTQTTTYGGSAGFANGSDGVQSGTSSVGSGQGNLYSNAQGNGVPNAANAGEVLYTQGCSTCHGNAGGGGSISGRQVPSLIGVGSAAVDFWVSTGRMPINGPYVQAPRKEPIYNRDQINALISYVTSLSPATDKGPSIPNVDIAAGDLSQGAIAYANNCAACHNAQGSGGALGRDYYAPNLYQATPTQIGEALRTGPGSMPVFGPNTFSDAQVNSLAKYVTGLRQKDNNGGLSVGGLGPVSEGFVGWGVGLILLLALTRWIGTRV